MIPAVVSTESAAQRNSSRSMIHSSVRVLMTRSYFPLSFASSCSMVTPTVFCAGEHRAERSLGEAIRIIV